MESDEEILARAQKSLKEILKENKGLVQISRSTWITDNHLLILARRESPHIEPWATISQYIVGWYLNGALRKEPIGLARILHVNIILDCYEYPGTVVFTANGSPPKGRLIVELESYSRPPKIVSVTFIGFKVRRIMDINKLPKALNKALNEAIRAILPKWISTEDEGCE